jgi:aminomethyltransferase
MVPFAGWEMPLHYGSQIAEHQRVREHAGVFDVSHMRAADVEGARAREFLRRLLANDVGKLKQPGMALYSCMLNESGGVLDDLIVYRLADSSYRVVLNAGRADTDLAWMRRQRGSERAEIQERDDLAILAVQGPRARERVWEAAPELKAASEPVKRFAAVQIGNWTVARTGYTGEDGFEIMLPGGEAPRFWQALLAQGVAPAGLGARDTLRLEAGMLLYGQDLDETVSPLESGLEATVDLTSLRDFTGRAELTRRPVTRNLRGLKLEARGVPRAGCRVLTAHGAGQVTSGTFSPTLNQPIALARVPKAVTAGEEVEIEIRDKMLPARVVKYPFVRNGRALV